MASTSSSSPQSQKANEQKKKPLIRSKDQVLLASDDPLEAKKSKTAPKSNVTKPTGIQSKSPIKAGGHLAKGAKKQATKRKRPLRGAATRARSQLHERADDPSPVALLDMLAEVASATLKNDPSIRPQQRRRRKMNTRANMRKTRSISGTSRKTRSGVLTTKASKNQRRSAQSEHLSLDQIRMLSDKLLVNMFAELTADEIRRNYTYTCYLLPEKCHQKYTSFGNENRARMQMKTHLLGHIAELLSEANAAGRSPQKGKFTAEPMTARKRRLAVEQEALPIIRRRGGATVVRKALANTASNTKTTGGTSKKGKLNSRKTLKLEQMDEGEEEVENEDDDDEEEGEEKGNKETKSSEEDESHNGVVSKGKVAKETSKSVATASQSSSSQAVQELICYEQPLHDHCYTTVDGGKNLPDHYNYEEDYDDDSEDGEYDDDEEEEEEDEEKKTNAKVMAVPDLRKGLVVVAQIDEFPPGMSAETQTTFRSKQAEMALRQLEAIRQLQMQNNRKVVVTPPPTPPSNPREFVAIESEKRPNLRELEVELMDSDSEKREVDMGSPEWERRLALKYIHMLRAKKKDEQIPLVCQICKGKSFTAQATLMYHYRSHAGIKPFLCTICNTTFTRQHSLNYHMLIHNNKSRFTCSDCGRKFRHPSHFKEHLRRHTGETPFECSDCGVRFKTRNTYKRHLKTRHGKLLTVNGIVMLSNEEFLLVKTNPKMKNQPPRLKKDQQTQWPEPMSTTACLNLNTMALSNIPLMADIDSGMFLSTGDNNAVRVQVVAEPSSQHLPETIGEINSKNFMVEERMMVEGADDENGDGIEMVENESDAQQYTCISIGVGTEGQNAEQQNIIFLEAVPMESSKEGEMEGQIHLAQNGSWTTSGSFSNQSETIQAAVLLQPILQCM